jgi:membrane protease YdiL (CAAX protease family)
MNVSRPAPIWFVLGALIASFIVSIVALDTYLLFTGVTVSSISELTPLELLINEAGLWLVFVSSAVYAAHRFWRSKVADIYRLHFKPFVDLPIGLVVGIAAQLLIIPLLYLPITASNPKLARKLSAPAEALVHIGSRGDFLVVFAILVIGAPVAEELFFRGLVLRSLLGLTSKWGNALSRAMAIIGSSLVFALAHFEPLQFLGLLAVGAILGILALVFDRIGPNIVAHASFNLVAVVALAKTHL